MASSVVDAFRGSIGKKNNFEKDSEKGERDSVKNDNDQRDNQSEKRSFSNFFMNKNQRSHKSGSGAGSIVTSISDLERIEKIMNTA